MITAHVVACNEDTLPDLDASDPAAAVLRVLTDHPDRDSAEFWMDRIDPKPQTGDAISYGIKAGFLGSHQEVDWRGQRVRQRGYAHDPSKSEDGALY